ncbi:MAG TPA: D-2-hydroxyacid dehydrogenase [Streptosporangiaceae bacterium]|nr:D-2-hydroxyacid dehydrogenase [Streptosporangiaceae bacterium]
MTSDRVHVLVASPLEPEHVARIEAADPRVSVLYEPGLLPVPRYPCDHNGVPRSLSPADLDRWAGMRQRADVSFDFDWQAPAGMAANCPRLRWVQGTSAGIGGFLDRTGLADTPLVFTTAAGVHAIPLAEFALFGLLYFAKDMPLLARRQRERHWQRLAVGQLAGRRVLLVGLGGTGRAVARLLAAAGVEVTGSARTPRHRDAPGVASFVAPDQLGQVLNTVDALVLACPLTEQTRHLIAARELALMRPGAVLVNISRGQVVDEDALTAALSSGHLGGACLDVFETEPLPASSPLWQLENVIISPHSASTVAAENHLLAELFTDNLQRWLAGRPLRNVYDRTAGY